jgi:hypothetical protein
VKAVGREIDRDLGLRRNRALLVLQAVVAPTTGPLGLDLTNGVLLLLNS